jgi:trans-aconitate 2-methyltransferase
MSTESTTKRFDPIRADHAFFDEHATEAAAHLRAYLPQVRRLTQTEGPVRVLDFGCGAGGFTAQFLTHTGLTGKRLALALVEPDEEYRRQAVARLQGLAGEPVAAWPQMPPDLEARFDLVLSNHALYYVVDLDDTLRWLRGALAPGGLFLAGIAGQDNVLIQMWNRCFALIGIPVPHRTAEDVEAALARLGQPCRKEAVPYQLAFPDTEGNRLKIMRFLLGDYYFQVLPRDMLDLFEPYARDGRIDIQTAAVQFAFDRG